MVFFHNINPVLLHLDPLQVRYYGLIYLIDFIIVALFVNYFYKKKKLGITRDQLLDVIFYCLIGGIVFARIFYIVIYGLSYFLQNPLHVFFLWEGGLSFHGGIFGAVAVTYVYCRMKQVNFLRLADLVIVPFAFALCLGRIGNFLNGELYGRITSLPWGMNFGGEVNSMGKPVFRHPSQLYEAAKNLVNFFILFALMLKDNLFGRKLPDGFLFWLFFILYGIFRFFIEFVREPDANLGFIIGFLTMGQLLCIAMILLGAIGQVYVWKRQNA